MAQNLILALDLDGVVITGHADGGHWYKYLERDLGVQPREIQEMFFQTPRFSALMVGEVDLHDALRLIWPQLRCEAGVEEFIDYWFAAHSMRDLEVLSVVDRWREEGNAAYLASNQEHYRARYVWEKLGLSKHFDGMLYSAQLGAQKPSHEFFTKALSRLPVSDPSEILFLDDSLANVEAAAIAGWNALHFRGVGDLRRALQL